jgi:creatinine amidohydrolase
VTVREIADALLGSGAKAGADPRHRAQHHRSVEASIRGCRDPSLVRHLKAFAGPRFANTVQALKQQPYGSHADEMETSLMLAIAPGLVDIARPMPSPYRETAPLPGPLSPDDSYSPNYSPSGSFGDPTLASAEKGKRLLAAILEDLMEMAA